MNSYSLVPILILLTGVGMLVQQYTTEQASESVDTEAVLGVVEEIRIGDLDGEEEYTFGNISHIAVGQNGEIFIADSQVPVVRMYDEDGNFIRNVGRQGRGPGEYNYIIGMQSFPDGRLATSDPRNLRINVYDPQGDFIESHNVPNSLFASHVFRVDHSGNFYVQKFLRSTPDMPNPKFGWLKISPEGAIADTIKVPLDKEEREQTFVLFTANGDAHAFIEWPLTSMSPMGYLITGRNDDYSFELNLSDSTVQEIERNFTPVQIKQEEKDQWEDWVTYYDTNNIIPETKPAYKKILTDMQGRIWVWRYVEAVYTEKNIGPHYGPESRWWEPPTFDVFLPDGSFYATIILPLNANFRDAKDDHVWAVLQGGFGEEYVVRYRIEMEKK